MREGATARSFFRVFSKKVSFFGLLFKKILFNFKGWVWVGNNENLKNFFFCFSVFVYFVRSGGG
ncbi:hypothetical protein SU45_06420 [Brachyspira hyodysenteriae]|nr:hypothetical protein SU45_06420 [Brachyspira hyodysenteriae]KLI62285.1 hypothetical protein SZ46_02480 [Brachyspira hyodysenteriae]